MMAFHVYDLKNKTEAGVGTIKNLTATTPSAMHIIGDVSISVKMLGRNVNLKPIHDETITNVFI